MTAETFPSTAMQPHVAVLYGYQAGCDDERCALDEPGVLLGDNFQRWWGEFRDTWIDAKLDAVRHNIENHPRAQPSWEEIIHGHHADDVHAVRAH